MPPCKAPSSRSAPHRQAVKGDCAWLGNLKTGHTTEHAIDGSLPSFDALSVMKLSEFQEPNPIIDLDMAEHEQPSPPDAQKQDGDSLKIERGEAT